MALYRMAGLYVEMNPRFDRLKEYAESYLYRGSEIPDEVIRIAPPEERLRKMKENYPDLSMADCEYLVHGFCFSGELLYKNGFVLHASAVAYKGNAYLFSADSGTGKSTHTGFWQEVFGKENAVIINDDKPALREIDGVFYASGTPFSGKNDISNPIDVPVKSVCFIHRAEKCEIKKLDPSEVLELIFKQVFYSKAPEDIAKLFEVIDRFLAKVPVYSLGVTNSPEAARFAYNELSK